jgi:hypothetical protein
MQGDYKNAKRKRKKKFILLIIIKKDNNEDFNVGKNIINKKKQFQYKIYFKSIGNWFSEYEGG